jgi:hypothetical protein
MLYIYIYNELCWFVLLYFLYFLLGLKGQWNGVWSYNTFLKHFLWENNKGSFTLLKKKNNDDNININNDNEFCSGLK